MDVLIFAVGVILGLGLGYAIAVGAVSNTLAFIENEKLEIISRFAAIEKAAKGQPQA